MFYLSNVIFSQSLSCIHVFLPFISITISTIDATSDTILQPITIMQVQPIDFLRNWSIIKPTQKYPETVPPISKPFDHTTFYRFQQSYIASRISQDPLSSQRRRSERKTREWIEPTTAIIAFPRRDAET